MRVAVCVGAVTISLGGSVDDVSVCMCAFLGVEG